MKRLQFRRGRYILSLWPPVIWETERGSDALGRDDGWFWVGLAWGWNFRGRWNYRVRYQDKERTLLQGFRFGPVDLRRVR